MSSGIFSSTSSKKENVQVSFEDQATFFTQAIMSYLNPVFQKGGKESLTHEDLGIVAKQDKCDTLHADFMKAWSVERTYKPQQRSLWRVLWKTVGYSRISLGMLLYAGYTALSFGPILILNVLTQYLQGSKDLNQGSIAGLVILLFFIPMIASICAAQSNVIMAHIGLQFRNALITMIYRKSLRLSPAARQAASTGQIVNMFSNDTAQIQRFLFFMNNVALAPAQIAVSIALIYLQVGAATFVGLALLVVLMPFNGIMFQLMSFFRTKKVKVTDKRVKLMNEILSGIRVIKNYAWENAFISKITEIRMKELIILKQLAYVVAIGFTLILTAAPTVQPVLIFYTYVRLGNQLDAATIFTSIALFNLMQMPFAFLPLGLSQYSQSLVSSKRILEFFVAEELDPYVDRDPKSSETDGFVVKMEGVSACWAKEGGAEVKETKPSQPVDKKTKEYELVAINEASAGTTGVGDTGLLNRAFNTLMNVNLNVKKGQLIAVVGSVGSGKSSFLSALLGELHLKEGYCRVIGTVAYCDQRPWILNATVQDNILFGRPLDEAKLQNAIHAASLEDDIKILPGGILTEIGEKGINLSGGQKARVALARAVYYDTDVYLLDDPLSAVDAHVGQHIFQHCIKKVLAGRTRILVTHHVHLLHHCDIIVVMEDGKVKASGSYEELRRSGVDISTSVPHATAEEEVILVDPNVDETIAVTPETDNNIAVESMKKDEKEAIVIRKSSVASTSENKSSKVSVKASSKVEDKRSTTLMTTEEKKLGDVDPKTYSYYIRAGGIWLFSSLVMSLLAGQGFQIGSSFWLSYWGTVSFRRDNAGEPLSTAANIYFLNVYAAFACAYLGLYTIRSILLANHRLGTSVKLHASLLKRVLGAPVAFFDVTPLGRILNRFSSDLLTVDEELSQTISQVSNSLLSCIGALFAIAAATKGTFTILMLPLMLVYNRVQIYFRKTNTTVARLESISRSPIYADFSQALSGMGSIRAYHEQDRFVKHLEFMVDRNSIANITSQNASQWLAIRLDLLGSIVTFFIALIAVVTPRGFIPAGYMALGLSYSFQMTTYLKFCVRMIASLEAQMNSVERIMFYVESVEQEGHLPGELAPDQVPPDWPTRGTIRGKNVQMRYREGPLVLKGVDFEIQSNEKIGIAGRTGSGKSSMMIALFRIQELADGSIFIDDIDTATIPLQILRSKLGIIPQDPVMFSSTIRFNLDPFSEHTDADLWDVLESVRMKDHVLTLTNKLNEEVAEGGDNFSAGQRQLICIARALLRRPKILVLDEATASIDNETDAFIQTMVREQFKSSTVLTIAHRLHTIIDSSRIMVLETGNLVEFDTPENLLAQENGLFKLLWDRHQVDHQ